MTFLLFNVLFICLVIVIKALRDKLIKNKMKKNLKGILLLVAILFAGICTEIHIFKALALPEYFKITNIIVIVIILM